MLELRTVTSDEFIPWLHAESRAYGNRLDNDPEVLRPHFDLARSIAIFEDGSVVGGAHSHSIAMSIPGGAARIAGVANIAVQPTHRRQGVLTQMMRHQIHDIHARGEPMAALFASESAIYGRFGYGIGSLREQWAIDRHHNRYARRHEPGGRLRFVDPADITRELPEVCRRSTVGRPGLIEKPLHHWEQESRAPEHQQGGRGGLFYVAYDDDAGRTQGYAKYRTTGSTLVVNELMAVTRDANAALWRFCFDVDLITRTEAEKRPVDDPMPWLLADPRRLQRSTRDGMWLRLVDAPAALQLRTYQTDDRLTLQISDDLCDWNNGCFDLAGSPDGAACRPSQSTPDLSLTIAGLASAYLGAAGFTTLSQAGLVNEQTPGALHRADKMFAVPQQPWTPHNF